MADAATSQQTPAPAASNAPKNTTGGRTIKPLRGPICGNRPDRPFDLTIIPDLMDDNGWTHAAELLRFWFAGVAFDREGRSHHDPTLPTCYRRGGAQIITMDWVRGFDRAASVFDDHVKTKLKTANARAQLVNELDKQGLFTTEKTTFGDQNGEVPDLDLHYFTQANVADGGMTADLDDLAAALHGFSFYFVAGGEVTPRDDGDHEVHVTWIGAYVHDQFDFIDPPATLDPRTWLGQPLGVWANSCDQQWRAHVVWNSDFRQWRADRKKGGDFIVFSDLLILEDADIEDRFLKRAALAAKSDKDSGKDILVIERDPDGGVPSCRIAIGGTISVRASRRDKTGTRVATDAGRFEWALYTDGPNDVVRLDAGDYEKANIRWAGAGRARVVARYVEDGVDLSSSPLALEASPIEMKFSVGANEPVMADGFSFLADGLSFLGGDETGAITVQLAHDVAPDALFSWSVSVVSSQSGSVQPSSGQGAQFEFRPRFAGSERSIDGSQSESAPIQYSVSVEVRSGDGALLGRGSATLKQDKKDVIRQEYLDFRGKKTGFKLEIPSRDSIVAPDPSSSFDLTVTSNYKDFVLEGEVAADLAARVEAAYQALDPTSVNSHLSGNLGVNSGWRNPRRNAASPGSATNSNHQIGRAVDLRPDGIKDASYGYSHVSLNWDTKDRRHALWLLFRAASTIDDATEVLLESGGTLLWSLHRDGNLPASFDAVEKNASLVSKLNQASHVHVGKSPSAES